ncbi:phage tail protein [Chromobacterium subtsugae]|uniref:Phage tail protein n=1 Tax=Chromobacterium subtsugae TaxID=251747 RepID=A0ABS7FEC1_9NEIS|nr:phage tail protein [Chromobacterium subtsugae]MBW8288425.1 phage tail protein [Chromobacterium subtsugae]
MLKSWGMVCLQGQSRGRPCAFLAKQRGVSWFWFAGADGNMVKVTCQKPWKRTDPVAGSVSLTCTFEQVFDAG